MPKNDALENKAFECSKCGNPKLMCKCPPPGDSDDDDSEKDDKDSNSDNQPHEADLENPGNGEQAPTEATANATNNELKPEPAGIKVDEKDADANIIADPRSKPDAENENEDAREPDESCHPSPFSIPTPFATPQCTRG